MSTSLHRIATDVLRLGTLGVLALFGRDAWSITISPSPSNTGNYTVSGFWTGCYEDWTNYPYYAGYICYYLVEQTGGSAPRIVATADGTTSWSAFGKAPGTYTYYVYLTYGYGDQYIVTDTASVTVGTPPPRDPLVTQLGYQFQTRRGDINADGKMDLFVKRIAGGVAGNGVLDVTILRQNASGGTFTAVVPTASESSVASGWPVSGASIVVTDFNADGFVDVEVKGVAAATGMSAATDQIVFSSGVPFQAQPLGVRAVDAALKKFVGNMMDYIVNPNYFREYADLKLFQGTYPVYYCSVSWGPYGAVFDYWYHAGLSSCWVYVYHVSGYYWDYREFSPAAVSAWTSEARFHDRALTRTDALAAIEGTFRQVLGVAIGGWDVGEITGPNGRYSDLDERGLNPFLVLLGIGNANAQEIVTDEAPRPVPREPGVIHVVGRYIFVAQKRGIHSVLQYTTSGLTAPTWLSAFDSAHESGADDGTLLAETNDPRDHPLLTQLTLGWVIPPGNGPRSTYWFNEVLPAHNHYRQLPLAQKAPYDAMPEYPCLGLCAHYNSNSYVQGLIEGTGGDIIPKAPFLEDFDDLVGGGSPLPASYFGR